MAGFGASACAAASSFLPQLIKARLAINATAVNLVLSNTVANEWIYFCLYCLCLLIIIDYLSQLIALCF
jgi:hypothetical protein